MGLNYSNKTGQYWNSLRTHARIYEEEIDRLLDKILSENNAYYASHSSKYSTKYKLYKLLGGDQSFPEKAKADISIMDGEINCTPNIDLTDGRKEIVDNILQSKRTDKEKLRLIGGVYGEQWFQDKINTIMGKRGLTVEDLIKQLSQFDMYVKLNYDPKETSPKVTKNINKLLTDYGLILDHKPNIFKFDVTTYKDENMIIDWTQMNPNNWKDDAIAKILYKKYQNYWPFFVSSNRTEQKSAESHIVTPTEFFGNPAQFDIDLLNKTKEVTRKDLESYGFSEEEARDFLEDPGVHYDEVVNQLAMQKLIDILQKSYRIKFTKKK